MRRFTRRGFPPAIRRIAAGAAMLAALGLLLAGSGCATDKWCNKLNDYSTLGTDQEYCRQKAGFLADIVPVRYNDCMKSLGWHPCDEKPAPSKAP